MMIAAEISEKIAKGLADKFNAVAMCSTVLMLILLVVDIVGTKFFHWPLPGSVDLIGELLMLVAAFGMAQTEILRKHIRVDFLVSRLSARLRNMLFCVGAILGFGIFVLLIVSSVQYAKRLFLSGEKSFNLQWPLYPLPAILAFTCLPILIVFVWEFFCFSKGDRKKCH
jgi:TRAP-type C4-dicarboxylate transport system permease small subunit